MASKEKFIEEINSGNTFKGESIVLGGAMLNKEAISNCLVKIPLRTMNRHGLIAGSPRTRCRHGIFHGGHV